MKLLLHTSSFKFSAEQRQALLTSWPEVEVMEQSAEVPEELAGADVTILVTEQVPRNLASWTNLRWVQLLSAGANQLCDQIGRAHV